MKKLLFLFGVLGSMLLCPSGLLAMPLDLSGFTATDNVVVGSNEVNFTEDTNFASWYFYNDNFVVDNNAQTLSFNYDFLLGPNDQNDYLAFDFNNVSQLQVVTTTTGGNFGFDLSSYRGQQVSLAWGLVWGGDESAGSSARVYNFDLSQTSDTSNAVPEPTTLLLFATGFAGLLRRSSQMRAAV